MPSTSKSSARRWQKKPPSKPKQVWRVKQPTRNWLQLPPDLTANILQRIGVIDILENAQKVCTSWHRICRDPAMWRVIDLKELGYWDEYEFDMEEMCKHAVDRSEGQLVDINIENFGSGELLQYIADRSSQLRRLRIVSCFGCVYEGLTDAFEKLPLLEDLSLTFIDVSKEAIEVIGRCCPMLKSLKLNKRAIKLWDMDSGEEGRRLYNEQAVAIGGNLPELRQLELIGNSMLNFGLQAILDGCCRLESLDLRRCPNINLKGDLGKRCLEQIKNLKLPHDFMEVHEFDAEIYDSGASELSGYSDLEYSDHDGYYGYSDYDDFTTYDDFTAFDDFTTFEMGVLQGHVFLK